MSAYGYKTDASTSNKKKIIRRIHVIIINKALLYFTPPMMKRYTYISTFNRTILQGILLYLKLINITHSFKVTKIAAMGLSYFLFYMNENKTVRAVVPEGSLGRSYSQHRCTKCSIGCSVKLFCSP